MPRPDQLSDKVNRGLAARRRAPAKSRKPSDARELHRFAILLEYDGTDFSGFQWQKNGQSVQAVLEAAIDIRFREKRRVVPASRTDAGVHARGQVAIFDLHYAIQPEILVLALNSALPSAVRVLRAWLVKRDWQPRLAALKKTYEYVIYNRPIYSPLFRNRAWQISPRLNLTAMRRAAGYLLGRHDFSSFRAIGCSARHPVRNLQVLKISRQGDLIKMRFTADAFLYHMIRNLVGTLVEVGRGRVAPQQIKNILKACNRKLAGPTAPACGLYLEEIQFARKPSMLRQ